MKKYILPAVLSTFCSCGAKQPEAKSKTEKADTVVVAKPVNDFEMKNYVVNPDSVFIEHTGRFGKHKYEGEGYQTQDAVFFKLTVTNKGKNPIPTIQTARKNGLSLIVNGNSEVMFMTLANFASGADQTLAKDSSDHWEMDFEITGPQPVDFGNPFTFQWVYMGIPSKILEADIQKHTLKAVTRHRPDNFSNR